MNKVGGILKLVWNLFLAGKTVKVKGIPVVLPQLDADQGITAARPIMLIDAITSPEHR